MYFKIQIKPSYLHPGEQGGNLKVAKTVGGEAVSQTWRPAFKRQGA